MMVLQAGLGPGRNPVLWLCTAFQDIGWRMEAQWSKISCLGTIGDERLGSSGETLTYLEEGLQFWGRRGVMGSMRQSQMLLSLHFHPSHKFSSSRAWPVFECELCQAVL